MILAANIIRQLLIDLELGSASLNDWPIYVSFLPSTPDNAICIYDTAGKFDGRIMRSGERVSHPGIQVMVRGKDYAVVSSLVETIAESLDSQIRTEVDTNTLSYLIHNISRQGEPIPLGVETEGERRRHLFSINAITTISRLTIGFEVKDEDDLGQYISFVTSDDLLYVTQQ